MTRCAAPQGFQLGRRVAGTVATLPVHTPGTEGSSPFQRRCAFYLLLRPLTSANFPRGSWSLLGAVTPDLCPLGNSLPCCLAFPHCLISLCCSRPSVPGNPPKPDLSEGPSSNVKLTPKVENLHLEICQPRLKILALGIPWRFSG